MTPKSIKPGAGEVYYQAPEGLQQLYPLDEAPEAVEGIEWPKENPYIKPTTDATFTAEMLITPEVSKAFATLGEACKRAAEALGRAVRAAADCAAAIARGVDIAQLLKAVRVQEALKEAPPRVRHLAQHSKKHRTRKKNINRALREYQRRTRKRDRP